MRPCCHTGQRAWYVERTCGAQQDGAGTCAKIVSPAAPGADYLYGASGKEKRSAPRLPAKKIPSPPMKLCFSQQVPGEASTAETAPGRKCPLCGVDPNEWECLCPDCPCGIPLPCAFGAVRAAVMAAVCNGAACPLVGAVCRGPVPLPPTGILHCPHEYRGCHYALPF